MAIRRIPNLLAKHPCRLFENGIRALPCRTYPTRYLGTAQRQTPTNPFSPPTGLKTRPEAIKQEEVRVQSVMGEAGFEPA